MPRVPVTPTVGAQPFQAPQFSAPRVTPMQSAAGEQAAALGESMVRAGAAASAIGLDLQADNDEAVIAERDALLMEELNNLYRGPNGYLNRIGAAATDDAARQRLRDDEGKLVTKLSAGLATPAQREKVQRLIDYRLAAAHADADDHYAKQVRVHGVAAAEARIALAVETTAGNPKALTPEGGQLMRETRTIIEDSLQTVGDHMGYDKAQRDLARLQALSSLHGAVLDKALRDPKQVNAARAYFNQHQGEMTDDVRKAASKVLDEATTMGEVVRVTRSLEQNYGTFSQRLEALDDMALKSEVSDKVYQNAYQQLKRNLEAQEISRATQQVQLVEQARRLLAQDAVGGLEPGQYGPDRPVRSMEELLGPGMLVQLREAGVYDTVQEFAQRGRWTTTDFGRRRLSEVSGRPTELVGASMEETIARYRRHLDDRDMERMLDVWREANGIAPLKKVPFTEDERSFYLNRLLGVVPKNTPLTPEQNQERMAIWYRLESAVIKAQPKDELAKRELMDRLIAAEEQRKVVVNGAPRLAITLPENFAQDPSLQASSSIDVRDIDPLTGYVQLSEMSTAGDELRALTTQAIPARVADLDNEAAAMERKGNLMGAAKRREEAAALREAVRSNDPVVLLRELAAARKAANAARAKKAADEKHAKEVARADFLRTIKDGAAGPMPMGWTQRRPWLQSITDRVFDDPGRPGGDVETLQALMDAVEVGYGMDVPGGQHDPAFWRRYLYQEFVWPKLRQHSAEGRIDTRRTGPYGARN